MDDNNTNRIFEGTSSVNNAIINNNEDEEDTRIMESKALPLDKRICIVGNMINDQTICSSSQSFGVSIVTSANGYEYAKDTSCSTIFVIEEFDGEVYDLLYKSKHPVLGPPAIKQLALRNEKLPNNIRPLYTLAMVGVVVCFTGFRDRDNLGKLLSLVHHMGGSVRKEMSTKVTHLIANVSGGYKYQYATTFRVPVMHCSWVSDSWERRDELEFSATDERFVVEHKLKPFYGARVCFHGFPEEEEKHMIDVLQANGGTRTNLDDPSCTHVVVDEGTVTERPELTSRAHVVKAEWFWTSVQKEVSLDEKNYLFDDYIEQVLTPNQRRDSHQQQQATTSSASRRKRKRLYDALSSLTHHNSHHHQQSPGSFLDCTPSPDKALIDNADSNSIVIGGSGIGDTPKKSLTPRQQVFIELVQTESNYVNILNTINTMFKKHLEEMSSDEALLNNTELKIIFGNLPPIYETHVRMLEELRRMSANWSEDKSIGNTILRYSSDLLKAYPPFVNFFEETKDMLTQCDTTKPRFHAFLKACQTRPECGRQTLQDLLIRPVQRLPSISLLLNDILKHTSKSNADHAALEQALAAIREVMTHINEDKRKTEGQKVMFDIFNDIDNCPPDLLSSHRNFITKLDVVQISSSSDGLSSKGNPLILFLFSDQLEVCKKRSKAFNTLKSPNTINGVLLHKSSLTSTSSASKPYKHVRLMPLSTIKRVIDIKETEDCQRVFTLIFKSNEDSKEKSFSFAIVDDDTNKQAFLKTLCRQMANNACTPDADQFLIYLEPHQLNIDTSDVNGGTLSKAFKFATRTSLKVGRAFSFNKTPSKLKRAVSSMMSPFGSSTNLTPASQLAQMRLASCTNINELGGHAMNASETQPITAPMSVQPSRKLKTSSLTIPSLKRL